jgi:hypothetical protein
MEPGRTPVLPASSYPSVRHPQVMKLSARNIQMFVAGAFVLPAFRTLIWLPYYFAFTWHNVFAISASILVLLLGVGISIGGQRALFWARFFLWIGLLGATMNLYLSTFQKFGLLLSQPHQSLYRSIADFFTVILLLWLLVWSRSKRFADDRMPDAALEPTPTTP